jgi:DNA-binding MarR family transcriptional regulator
VVPRRQQSEKLEAAAGSDIDIGALWGCTCMHIRRAARRVTQVYDQAIAPTGLTSGQFGLLARLHAAALHGEAGLSIGALADQHGMDPTTLNRNLQPLLVAGLIHDDHDPTDRRVRKVFLTVTGRERLAAAMPLWRQAQRRMEAALGAEATLALNGLLDLSVAKLEA